MNFHILTLFPEMIEQGIGTSITGKAMEQGKITVNAVNIQDYTEDKHKKVDDYPYGGGAGMLMQAQPVYDCFQAVKKGIDERRQEQVNETQDNVVQADAVAEQEGTAYTDKPLRVVYVTPQGKTFTQQDAEDFAKEEDLVILCGHYEGIDERVLEEIVTDYVSIGDFVLTGGELPAMVMVDAISRLVPDVLHNEASAEVESFHMHLLEFSQYSRPEVWHDKKVPDVLLSGNHKKIETWRLEQSIKRTIERRPDLYRKYERLQKSVEWLMKDKLLNMDMIEVIRRGWARLFYGGKDGVLLQEKNSGVFMLSTSSKEAGEKILDGFMPKDAKPEFFVVHQSFQVEMVEERFSMKKANECLTAVYTRNVTLPVKRVIQKKVESGAEGEAASAETMELEIKQLDGSYLDEVYTDYKLIGGKAYIEERLKGGAVYGAFADGELAGFIGMHDEGSIGMLHVKEKFRRLGIAAALESDAINRTLALGWLPFGQIFPDNAASLALQEKLGLRVAKTLAYGLEKI